MAKTWSPQGCTPVHYYHQRRRDKVSVISGISVSPRRQRLGLYYQLYFDNIGQEEVCLFLRELLRHLRGPVIVLLDNSSTHQGLPLRQLLQRHRRLLELEIIPHEARLKLTRLIRDACQYEGESAIELVRTHEFVNIANQVMERPIYVLEPDEWGEEYMHADYAWLRSQRELIMRIPTTIELVEILADYLQQGLLRRGAVNAIRNSCNCGFSFAAQEERGDKVKISVEILSVDEIPDADLSHEHVNIRSLVKRMDRALEGKDAAGVLHVAASIFETLAKDVLKNPNVDNRPLGGFFEAYRQRSLLPDTILDYMLQVYKDRNTTPLAGHGSTKAPDISEEHAIVLAELTKAIIRSERSLAVRSTSAKHILGSHEHSKKAPGSG